jgi:Immunity protein Imm1
MNPCEIEIGDDRRTIQNENELRTLLRSIGSRPDPEVTVYNASGDDLFVAVRDEVALIVFHQASRDPPYFSASIGRRQAEYYEFFVGDTPTPVPRDRCIPIGLMEQVVVEFVETGELSKIVNWIED